MDLRIWIEFPDGVCGLGQGLHGLVRAAQYMTRFEPRAKLTLSFQDRRQMYLRKWDP